MGAAGLPSNVLFLSSAVLYVLFLFLSLHLCDLNTSLEPLLFTCGEQYNKYKERKKKLKKSAPPAMGKDNEIEKKVSTEVHVCGIENSSSHLQVFAGKK